MIKLPCVIITHAICDLNYRFEKLDWEIIVDWIGVVEGKFQFRIIDDYVQELTNHLIK